MLPVTRSYGPGITGAQDPIPLEFQPYSSITAAVDLISTMDVAVEVTLDQVFEPTQNGYVPPASASWYEVTWPIAAPTTVRGYVTFPGPWRAIRLNITGNAGGVIFQVAQGSTPRN